MGLLTRVAMADQRERVISSTEVNCDGVEMPEA
jgi:hypothetical protein